MSKRKKDLRPPWTPNEDVTVREELRYAARVIAEATGRPLNGVQKHIRKLFADGKPIFLLLLTLCLFACQPAKASQFSIESAWDYELGEAEVLWWADPNNAVGIGALTDSLIPESSAERIAVGAVTEFDLTGWYDAAWDTVLPGEWVPSDTGLARSFGKLGIFRETVNDGDWIGMAATGMRFRPKKMIQPTVWTEVLKYEGQAPKATVMFGVAAFFGKP